MFDVLQSYCHRSQERFDQIPNERSKELLKLAEMLSSKRDIKVVFICTHNSRRSHFGQVWAQIAADFYGLQNVQTYSGGTEATAFHPNAIAALENAGCKVQKTSSSNNPNYELSSGNSAPSMKCFSKVYNHPDNPSKGFVAVMTCHSADEACPFVEGADIRVALTYIDPKRSDGTPEQDSTYNERCQQIATEMFFLFQHVVLLKA